MEAAFDPTTDTWRVLPAAPIAPRQDAASVWTGSEWVIWGDTDLGQELGDGAAYDPETDTWRPIATWSAPHPGAQPLWTGRSITFFAKGGAVIYDPAADRWYPDCCSRSISAPVVTAPPIWTGSQALAIGSGPDPSIGGWALTISESADR